MFKLQKRVDKAIRLLVEAELYQSEPNIDLAVKALKGGSSMKNEELAKIGMMFIHWIQVHRESINRFEDFRNCFVDDPDEPVHTKKDYDKAWEIQKEASVLGSEAKRRYETLLEEVDLYLARERTDVLEAGD